MEAAGFEVRDVESLREHYAADAARLGREPRGRLGRGGRARRIARARVWRLYLAASALGFDNGDLSIHQVLGVATDEDGASGMPLTAAAWERAPVAERAGYRSTTLGREVARHWVRWSTWLAVVAVIAARLPCTATHCAGRSARVDARSAFVVIHGGEEHEEAADHRLGRADRADGVRCRQGRDRRQARQGHQKTSEGVALDSDQKDCVKQVVTGMSDDEITATARARPMPTPSWSSARRSARASRRRPATVRKQPPGRSRATTPQPRTRSTRRSDGQASPNDRSDRRAR